MTNPFSVQTPEDISAKEAYELFVDVFSDFYQVPNQGHTFLHGPRGSGKSMMFRYMLPDCQALKKESSYNQLDYFSIYIPIKKTDLNIINLERLENNAQHILNEHLLVSHIASVIFKSLATLIPEEDELIEKEYHDEILQFYKNSFIQTLNFNGFTYEFIEKNYTIKSIFLDIEKVCTKILKQTRDYINRLFLNNVIPYEGCILSYLDFLYPLLCELKNTSFFPKGKPIFLLIDDADNLNLAQTKILNTWVSIRTSANVSLKISTQLSYKTYRTVSNQMIDSPHDYSEVNIATIYTSSKDKFYKRLKDIVEKRLKIYINKDINAEDFFPWNVEQEKRIDAIAEKIRTEFPEKGRGASAADDVKRYARPDYIKSLKEKGAASSYSYAGFEQLVSVSSGIVRYFLEPAAIMFSELQPADIKDINFIPYNVQDRVIFDYSKKYLDTEFNKSLRDENSQDLSNDKYSISDMLFNLLDSLGQLFHTILVSNSSERRVFSIALSSKPSKLLENILNLGVRYGYLHETTIGNKQGTGRTKLYILSRLLAPRFKIDATSFAGYKFINADILELALTSPHEFTEKMKKEINALGQDENILQLKIEF